jgi:hypothetical protein
MKRMNADHFLNPNLERQSGVFPRRVRPDARLKPWEPGSIIVDPRFDCPF